MPKQSAGILLYRWVNDSFEVFLVHPGGPFFKNKDAGAWTIPKGEFEAEDPLAAAKREFKEETGFEPDGDFLTLEPITQKGGKKVHAWALEGDIDGTKIVSNTFELEWPPKSGRVQHFPEIDKAEWFDEASAEKKINPAQWALVLQLKVLLNQD
ncbi:MAG: NUDIX domain-containing protein [Bacteroidota bacterium]